MSADEEFAPVKLVPTEREIRLMEVIARTIIEHYPKWLGDHARRA
jgi:hypothetical protein